MGSMSTEFRLLGPVEAVLGDQPASLGAPKQRALLAVLGEPYREFVRTRKRIIPFVY